MRFLNKRFNNKSVFILPMAILVFLLTGSTQDNQPGLNQGRELILNGCRWSRPMTSAFLLPGDSLFINMNTHALRKDLTLQAECGQAVTLGQGHYIWQAPDTSGVYRLFLQSKGENASFTIHAFVLIPFSQLQNGQIDGYEIGHYPQSRSNLPEYVLPDGFIKVTESNQNTPLSPHFTVKQFLCKQTRTFPQYMVLQPQLIIKLENIIDELKKEGFEIPTLHIMSGYRTPAYNQSLGNVKYSRHIYGDAADIFVDVSPRDQYMDDVNRDGQVDYKDAKWFFDRVNSWASLPAFDQLEGGLSAYPATHAHGPFIHIDTRGFASRWGDDDD